MNNTAGVQIDYETVDRITVCGLTDYRDSLKSQLQAYEGGSYMHPEDVVHNQKMVEAIEFVLKDFVSL
jgi:hypothetical protein